MSILAKAVTTAASSPEVGGLLLLVIVAMMAAAPFIAWRLGVYRRGSIRGPERIGGDMPVLLLVVVTFVAGGVWMIVQIVYVVLRTASFRQAHPDTPFDTSQLSAQDFAFLSTVPFAIGIALFVFGDRLLGPQIVRRIGYALRGFVPGVVTAIVGMLIVLPVMWVGSMALEGLYKLVGYQHPTEHELLGAMKDAPMHVRALLVIGACVAAPVFEELLFRGHVQTILVRLFTPRPVAKPLPPLAILVAPTADAIPIPPPIETQAVLEYEPRKPPAPLVWIAVLITSLIFAGFHPLWMSPLIFLLSLCLGYAYERTGNLWVNITMHALFNASSTLIFLNLT